jgi:elongation factor 3
MKAISKGQVEGFPPADQLVTVYVGHDLQSAEADKPVLQFILEDEKLSGKVERDEAIKVLKSVGFSDSMQLMSFSSLSGGWKMKLELARAMLMHADILLLDGTFVFVKCVIMFLNFYIPEPTNHLDYVNVAWLESYLCSLSNVTCMIVSHDSSFLDKVCTHIIDYDKKKLKFYKGNLSCFVKFKPEAKTYYDMSATELKFTFPKPGLLEGIRSKNRAILKMKNVTYAYPGSSVQALKNITVNCSLSSRIAINGPNGAGKSTLIKILTGEYIPDSGEMWKHPTLRVAYVAQHAFHHVEQHLDISPNEYIQWRYQYGEDKELLQKQTRQLSEEEKSELSREIVGKNGQVRRIEALLGRRKLKKSFEYEVKFVGIQPKHNAWMSLERLQELGFSKLMQAFDDKEAAREGIAANSKSLSVSGVQQHLDAFGLEADFGTHGQIRGLSGGQKVKLVLAAAMWNSPHLLVLDEPTNYLDRSALGALSKAIEEFEGGVVIISHNSEFTKGLAKEVWNVEKGVIMSKYKEGTLVSSVNEDGDESTPPGTPTGSDYNDSSEVDGSDADIAQKVTKSAARKKKPTRREMKEREIQKRLMYLRGEVSTMREVEQLDKEGELELPAKK